MNFLIGGLICNDLGGTIMKKELSWRETIKKPWKREESKPYSEGELPSVGKVYEFFELSGYSIDGKKDRTDCLVLPKGKFEVKGIIGDLITTKSVKAGYTVTFQVKEIMAGLIQFTVEN